MTIELIAILTLGSMAVFYLRQACSLLKGIQQRTEMVANHTAALYYALEEAAEPTPDRLTLRHGIHERMEAMVEDKCVEAGEIERDGPDPLADVQDADVGLMRENDNAWIRHVLPSTFQWPPYREHLAQQVRSVRHLQHEMNKRAPQ